MAIFAQLLQFYLNQALASQKQYQALLNNSKAYIMAELAKNIDQDNGDIQFTTGQVTYQTHQEKKTVTVTLTNQDVYNYQFLRQANQSSKEKTIIEQKEATKDVQPSSEASN
ncbi:competence type IV pilus minor pilin ComGG [Streptococcus sp. sy004]|uniref:competence type IV pilus minor pilin ComGG n=1 Tax=Streptococcus sp. sy004 TaxID=2600149 RepID=UPI0011B5AA73|nr:competence type IV pilus minor pilin ComGG [Streptococcus sp. sy004]TWT09818.1 competence protein ComGG [Streptococcus sp. sy004]